MPPTEFPRWEFFWYLLFLYSANSLISVLTRIFLLLSGTTTGKCKKLQRDNTEHLLHPIESKSAPYEISIHFADTCLLGTM